ncbi:hypothetical protein BVRB_9g209960 [Beta vulgaris subsp. vulgaris]|nr:hypothetical protein BVRB_9g209960 [Beta vulgaris subsp. vulgaris]
MEGDEYDENHKRKALDALRRMESWNLFSDTSVVFFCNDLIINETWDACTIHRCLLLVLLTYCCL